jgi:hypothetical protein
LLRARLLQVLFAGPTVTIRQPGLFEPTSKEGAE